MRISGAASRVGSAALVVALAGCAAPPRETASYRLETPTTGERHCAWFGDPEGGVLYFGVSAFWSTYFESGGDSRADLAIGGPQWLGRFDLESEAFLPLLPLDPPSSNGGSWDVLANGQRVYFTDYFGRSGAVDAKSGRVTRFETLGGGLNEIAPGPDGTLLVTRYGEGDAGTGSVVVLEQDGSLRAEHLLHPPPGYTVAAKSLAFDPVRREIWVNTDLLPAASPGEPGGIIGHDVRILGEDGVERLRFSKPEVQFMSFGPDGTGYFAELDGALLSLRVRPRERAALPLLTGRIIPLDGAFPAELDFVQDIQLAPDGTAVVTRWSGRIHLVAPDGAVETLRLPAGAGDLYYTAVLHDGRVCATRCGDVAVVCADRPAAAGPG